MPPFVHRRRVQFVETDMAGIVHFSNYYRWMEEAEHELFRSLGLKIMDPQGDRTYIGWPRVQTTCHYEAPIRYSDFIDIHVTVERIGAKSVTYYFEFYREDQRVGYGRTKAASCICSPDGTLRSIEVPENFRSVLSSVLSNTHQDS